MIQGQREKAFCEMRGPVTAKKPPEAWRGLETDPIFSALERPTPGNA